MSISSKEIIEKLQWRYATKQFDSSKKISPEIWEALEQSLILSPSSYGLQPWKFIIVENPEIRAKLKTASWNQSQVTDASHFVVFTTLKNISHEFIHHYIKLNAEVRGQAIETLTGFENMLKKSVEGMAAEQVKNWNQRQSYIAMGFLLETAALLNVDTIPMEGIDPKAYDDILGLTNTEYGTVAAVGLGYRSENDKYAAAKKVRFSREEIIKKI
jgi:nitroreductase